jgi:hypothetical protein
MNDETSDYVGNIKPRKITQVDIDSIDCLAMYEYMKQHMRFMK